tara:strand:+ start:278 stop:394 length:117 start_codon:yes stop_codon:yes gene_type:complete
MTSNGEAILAVSLVSVVKNGFNFELSSYKRVNPLLPGK